MKQVALAIGLHSVIRTLCLLVAKRAFFICTIALLTSAIAGQNARAQENPPPRSRVGDALYQPYLKAVLQSQIPNDREGLAVWMPDGNHIAVIMGAGGSVAGKDLSLIIWDFRRGYIVNRVPLPAFLGNDSVFVHGMTIDAKSTVALSVSVQKEGETACSREIFRYKFGKTYVWVNTNDPSAEASCQSPPLVRLPSPGGDYRMMDTSRGLAVFDAKTRQLVNALEKPEAFVIADAALSPAGKTIAIVAARVRQSEKYSAPVILFDLKSSRTRDISFGTRDSYDRVHWLDDRHFILMSGDGTGPILTYDSDTGKQSAPPLLGQCLSSQPNEMIRIGTVSIRCRKAGLADSSALALLNRLHAADGYNVDYDEAKSAIYRIDRDNGALRPVVLYSNVVAAGKMPKSDFFWVATRNNGIRFGGGKPKGGRYELEALSISLFREGKYITQTPYGNRYDTNLGSDTALFRWVHSNDGLTSLGPQTFMRDFYQPQLTRRILDCGAIGTCDDIFKRSLPDINPVLPTVTIDRVTPGVQPGTASVSLTISDGQGQDAYKRLKTSKAYGLRLFRNGSLVEQFPVSSRAEEAADIATWRANTLVTTGRSGSQRLTLPVALPTSTVAEDIRFSAYAFNEDRVKSETATAMYEQPAAAKPRPRRAFVVTFGIDTYDEKRLALQFAASDARLLGQQLASIPGYEVRRAIIAPPENASKPLRITAKMMRQVLGILAGQAVVASKAALKASGVDASQLEASTPDDVVIVSFAGHGWADKQGAFYLVPSDGKWPAGPEPVRSTLVSAVQIANQLRRVDAAEIALIIDACHSAGSVDNGSFKPGPMGDPGLGQLAFDKGIRIIAATQASDVALEDSALSQGLLTYALASEGITATGGKADGNQDGMITLDEWLDYAVKRVPALSVDARLGRVQPGTRAMAIIGGPPESRVKEQEPALFDFTGTASKIILRTGIRL